MVVLRLVKATNTETVETLEWMLEEARRGRLNDMLSSFRDSTGTEYEAFTGLYRADASKALMAVARMKHRLVLANDPSFGLR